MRSPVDNRSGSREEPPPPVGETDGPGGIDERFGRVIQKLLWQADANRSTPAGAERDGPWFLPTDPRVQLAIGVTLTIVLFIGSHPV